MIIKLKDLLPNPFKKYINGGKLNTLKIESLKESIKQDGFWDNIICRKEGSDYQIAYGHHRVEAAKQAFGGDFSVDIPCRVLSDEAMIRIMGNENNLNHEEDAIYQVDQVVLVKKFLEDGKRGSVADTKPYSGKRTDLGEFHVSAEEISKFLGVKNWSTEKVNLYLRLAMNLHPEILKKMKNFPNKGGGKRVTEFSVSHAEAVVRLPKDDQIKVFNKVNRAELSSRETEEVVRQKLQENEFGKQTAREKEKIMIDDVVGQITDDLLSATGLLDENLVKNWSSVSKRVRGEFNFAIKSFLARLDKITKDGVKNEEIGSKQIEHHSS